MNENTIHRLRTQRHALYINVLTCLFVAVILLMAATPLGYIPLVVIKLTLIHIPVILASLVLGPRRGLLLGFVFGLSSLVMNTLQPAVLSFAFSPFIPVYGMDKGSWTALIVCFVPRLLTGYVPGRLLLALQKGEKKLWPKLALASILGSLTNTVITLSLMALFFAAPFAQLKGMDVGKAVQTLAMLCVTNGLPEALAAAVIAPAIALPLRKKIAEKQQKVVHDSSH